MVSFPFSSLHEVVQPRGVYVMQRRKAQIDTGRRFGGTAKRIDDSIVNLILLSCVECLEQISNELVGILQTDRESQKILR